jgi:hypothetical protein
VPDKELGARQAPGSSPQSLLAQVAIRRRALDRSQALTAEKLSPDFNTFQFVDATEEGISRVMAWLLDRKGDHAQGDRFLRQFLGWLEQEWTEAALKSACTQTEATVASRGAPKFIDVLITGEGFACAIENKINAPDQRLQVTDYLSFLEKGFSKRHCLLYLTPGGRAPSLTSIAPAVRSDAIDSGALKERTYFDLQELLNAFRQSCRSDKVSLFIDDFIKHIGKTILGIENMEESNELADVIIDNKQNLSAALEIFDTQNIVKRLLMEKFESRLRARLEKKGWTLECDLTSGKARTGILIKFNQADVFGFGFQFYKSNYRDLFYGMARSTSADKRRKPVAALLSLLNDVQPSGAAGSKWFWWLYPKPQNHYFPFARDWAGNKDFWVAINDGVFEDQVISFVDSIHGILKKKRSLALLK